MVAMKAVVVLLVGLLVVCEGKKKEGLQEDFEFVEDGKEHSGTPSSGERRTWMLDPDNALCGLLRCGRREVCLLQDRFTAVCVNKAEVTRNGDKIVPLKDAASASYEDLPKSWDALDDYDDDDNDDDDDEDDEYYDEEEDEEYLLEDEDDDNEKSEYGSKQQQQQQQQQEQQQQQQQQQQQPQQPQPQQQPPQQQQQQPQQQEQQQQQPQGEKAGEVVGDQHLNRRPFAEKQCPSCPVVGPVFLCGSDNRTYSSTCRLNYHNCIHDANVHIACKGFCPCKDTNSHTAKKERQRERHDAYLSKLRATKNEPVAEALTSDTASSSSSSTASVSSSSRPEDRDNTTRGRLREAQQQTHNRDNGNRRDKHNREGDKFTNRVRSRLTRVKNNYKKNNDHEKSSYKKYNDKYEKENYRQMDKYNVQRRQWSRRTNEATHKPTNTVWGPNECTQDALEAMGNRMLDWFSVIMADARSRSKAVTKAPSWCKPEVSWMLGHLDSDGDGRLSVKELYQLEHDDHERCIKPFIDRCDLDRDIFLSAREWCKCFDKSERPCAALRKASKGLLECDSEGYYQATQCHAGAGVCWCVDRHGVELPNTRTRGTPNCEALVNSEEVSNYVDDDAEDGDDEVDIVEGSADMPLDI
ncbi:proteoglycan Cow isoform X2 [Cherax quadricarinatus]